MSAVDLINLSAYRRAELDAIDRATTKRLLRDLAESGAALTPPVLAVKARVERERPWRPSGASRRPMAVPDCGHDERACVLWGALAGFSVGLVACAYLSLFPVADAVARLVVGGMR